MSRRSSVVALVAVAFLVLCLPRTSQAQCTNIIVRGPGVDLNHIPCYNVAVTPDGTVTPTRATNGSGFTAAFTVKNTGFNSDTYTFTCQGTLGVTCSSFTPTSKTLASNATVTVTATYATGGTPQTGRLQLTATSINSDDIGYFSVPIVAFGVAVTPDGAVDTSRTANTSGYTRKFAVKNTGSGSNTYTLTCSGSASPVVTCGTPSPSSLTLAAGATDSTSVTYGVGAVGTGTVTLTATGTSATDNGSYSIPIVAAAVQVTPPAGTAGPWLVNSTGHTATFTVQNTGTARNTYTLTCGGTDVSCTNVNPASTTLNASATLQATVTYNAGASAGTGTVTLTATGGATATGTGNVAIVTASQQAPAVAAGDASPAATVERSLCLTIAMGQAAAAECGDLRVVHALPTTKTMNKARTPTLLYNSQFAHPYPLVALNVTMPATAVVPDSVRAVVKINSVARDSAAWVGSQWSQGQTRRIALAWDGLGDTTGVYTYTVEVRNKYLSPANQLLTTFTGTIAVVNRSTSPFGAGWWLAGVEHLNVSNMMWAAGDGSVRQYQPAGTNVWAAPNVDHPDVIRRDAVSGNYTRYDRDSLRVIFDPTGQHIATVNRQHDSTSFAWTSGRLTTITLPPSSAAKTYQFAYDANSKLQTVTAPAGTGTRTSTVTVTTGQVQSIRDPDNTLVQFAYSPSVANAMSSRTDRRGTVTSYSYDTGNRLSQSSINMGGSQPAIVTGLTALETRGFQGTSSVDTALAYAKLDGPRTDVADTTLFWVDLLGAPRKIVDALGNPTGIDRTDPNWPGLATKVTDPSGFQITAAYDSRANMQASIQVNPLGDGRNDTTSFVWDAKWDEVTKVTRPQGDSVNFAYSVATGNRLWQQDGRGSSTRVTFGYNVHNQVDSITRPGTSVQKIGYDATGNLDSATTPNGFLTTFLNDGAGRPTLISSPIDATLSQTQQVYYDSGDRDTLTVTAGPAMTSVGAESVFVRKLYNANGQDTLLTRRAGPDRANVGTIATRWRYDPAGRRVAEVAPDGFVDSTAYDAAGSTTVWVTRRHHTIGMTYDALNRLTRRVVPAVSYPTRSSGITMSGSAPPFQAYQIPADTQAFTYDALGRILTADNQDAKIKRSYFAGGLLATDSLRVRTVNGTDFVTHAYGLSSLYDLDGRRSRLSVPAQLGSGASTISYAYDPQFGALQVITDLQGNRDSLTYTLRGELAALTYQAPAQYQTRLTYDADGRVVRDSILNLSGTGAPRLSFSPVRALTYTYDRRDRLVFSADAGGFKDTLTLSLSGLGFLVQSRQSQHGHDPFGAPAWYESMDTFQYDGLGNRYHGVSVDSLSTTGSVANLSQVSNTPHGAAFQNGTGRLMSDTLTTVSSGGVTTFVYDSAGSNVFSQNLGIPADERASFYAADGAVRAIDVRHAPGPNSGLGPWVRTMDEYRYDALGRRVWARSLKKCLPPTDVTQSSECQTSILRRIIWDGDQILAEIQMPGDTTARDTPYWENDTSAVKVGSIVFGDGTDPARYFGRVIYTHGAGLDRPVAVTRFDYTYAFDFQGNPVSPPQTLPPFTILPFWTIFGDAPLGAMATGAKVFCSPSNSTTACAGVVWPYYWSAYDRQRGIVRDNWHGSLLEGSRDKSGLEFKRNRYYDPVSGRFTQEDPIGLAGGVNLYGFASGDPVNYSDPFGLCETRERGNATQSGVCSSDITGWTRKRVLEESHRLANNALAVAGLAELGVGQLRAGLADLADLAGLGSAAGRLGGTQHRAAVAALARCLESCGYDILAGGGLLPERAVQVGGGRIRFPDIIAQTPDGSRVYINVGRTINTGAPVPREVRALEDLNRTGVPSVFVPYDR